MKSPAFLDLKFPMVCGWLIVAVCMAATLPGCSERDADSLVVYSAGPRSLADWVCREFEKKTGVSTELYSATTGEIMAKLQAEEFRPQADVVILASPTAGEALKDQGMLARLPEGLKVRREWSDADGYYAGTGACALGIALREGSASRDLEWEDIWEGRFPGAFIMPSPSQSGSSAEFVIAFDIVEGERFWEGLRMAKRTGLQVSGPNSQALTGLVLRSHEAVLAAADYLVFRQIAEGEPLVIRYPTSGCPVISRPIGILDGAHNPKGAAEFVRFCFSPEVQTKIAAEQLLPADPGVPLSPERMNAGTLNPMPYDVAKAKTHQREALRRFQMEIEKSIE